MLVCVSVCATTGSGNPLVLIDEIDKLGRGYQVCVLVVVVVVVVAVFV